jgi:hypothetical protein
MKGSAMSKEIADIVAETLDKARKLEVFAKKYQQRIDDLYQSTFTIQILGAMREGMIPTEPVYYFPLGSDDNQDVWREVEADHVIDLDQYSYRDAGFLGNPDEVELTLDIPIMYCPRGKEDEFDGWKEMEDDHVINFDMFSYSVTVKS